MKELAITALGDIQGHAKALKMSTVGVLSRWDDIRDAETHTMVIS